MRLCFGDVYRALLSPDLMMDSPVKNADVGSDSLPKWCDFSHKSETRLDP